MLTLCLFINTNQNNRQYETYEQIDDLYESEAVKTKTTNCIKKVKNQEIIYYERNITIKNDIYKNLLLYLLIMKQEKIMLIFNF